MATERGQIEAEPLHRRERPALIAAIRLVSLWSWLQRGHELIAQRPGVREALGALLGYALTRLLHDVAKSDFEYALGWLVATSILGVLLFAKRQIDGVVIVCILSWVLFTGADVASERIALPVFFIGTPIFLALVYNSELPSVRRHIPYSFGALLGSVIGYTLVMVLGVGLIGLKNDFGLVGYFIAITIGIVLAIEMPITYRRHENRRTPTALSGGSSGARMPRSPSMVPLIFSIGLIMGIITTLALYVLRLLLTFGTIGYILALPIGALMIYGLRPR